MKITRAGLRRLPSYLRARIFETRWSLWDMILLSSWAKELLAMHWGPAILIFAVWLAVLAWNDKPWRNLKPVPKPEPEVATKGESIQLMGGVADGQYIKGWRGGDEYVAETRSPVDGAVPRRWVYRRVRPGSLIFEYVR